MPCMCGDTMCPSCGPAQGVDIDLEETIETLMYSLVDLEGYGEEQGMEKTIRALWRFPYIAAALSVLSEYANKGELDNEVEINERIYDIAQWNE